MAEDKSGIGGFRTQLGGFHKEDVIAYIHSMQEEHGRELETFRDREKSKSAAYEKALEDANAALREQYDLLQAGETEQQKLQELINEQYAVNRQLREQVEALTVDGSEREELERLRRINADLEAEMEQVAARYRMLEQEAEAANKERDALVLQCRQAQEEGRLRQQQTEEDARLQREQLEKDARQQLQQSEETIRRQQETLDALREENDRYRQLVNGAGGFVMDLRAMGRRYLDGASSRCDSRLSALTDAVAALQDQLTAASADLAEARDALREQSSRDTEQMDALGDEMMRTAAGLEQPKSAPSEGSEEVEKAETIEDIEKVEEEDVKDAPLSEEPAWGEETAPTDFF